MVIIRRFILLLFISDILVFAVDYCKLCKKGSHTLCRYKEGPSDRCKEYKKPEFTTSVKKYIVDIHNDIRNHIASGQELKGALGRQPPASNMNILQWDSELGEIAQRWADQCISLDENIQHDECRKTERFEVGQNVITAVTPSLDIPEIAILILNWYKQVQNVLPSDIENFSGIQRGKFLIGQYTQLVWAETRYFGCGMSTFKNNNVSSANSKYLHRLVCNYGPRGNMIGTSVYERGLPCSKCPLGKCDSVRTSLCEGEEVKYSEEQNDNYAQYHIDIPTYMFNTMSLGYILKHNLTDFIQNLLQNMNIRFGYDTSIESRNQHIVCSVQNSNKTYNVDEMLSILSIAKEKINTKAKGALRNKYTAYYNRIDSKRLTNMLNREENYLQEFNPSLYDLENGEIIVDDCKLHPQLSQFEDDEMATQKIPESGEIVLPNNIIYKKLKGIWFHGRCRCNYIYRSDVLPIRCTLWNQLLKIVLMIAFVIFAK